MSEMDGSPAGHFLSLKHKRLAFQVLVVTATVLLAVVNFVLNNGLVVRARQRPKSILADMYNPKQRPFYRRKYSFDCDKLANDEPQAKLQARNERRTVPSDYDSLKAFSNCELVHLRYYYRMEPDSDQERDFPIAYVILISEHLQQVEMLLNAIYAPQNLYCFHVDINAPYFVHLAMKRLASCFANVVLTPVSYPTTGETPQSVDALVEGIDCLYRFEARHRRRTPWRYLITLENHDFPLKTNREMVQILNRYGGLNDVELLPYSMIHHADLNESQRNASSVEEQWKKYLLHHEPSLPNVIFYGGSVVAAVSRPFVDHVRKHPIFHALQSYLKYTRFGEQLFWSTLNHNDQLGFPGAYPGRCAAAGRNVWMSRFSLWQQVERRPETPWCYGEWRNNLCVLSREALPNLVYRPQLFVHELYQTSDVMTIDCVHQVLYLRRYNQLNIGAQEKSVYEQASAVQLRKWLESGNSTQNFKCVTCTNCDH